MFSMNLMHKYVDFIVTFILDNFLLSLYYQTYVMNFHF